MDLYCFLDKCFKLKVLQSHFFFKSAAWNSQFQILHKLSIPDTRYSISSCLPRSSTSACPSKTTMASWPAPPSTASSAATGPCLTSRQLSNLHTFTLSHCYSHFWSPGPGLQPCRWCLPLWRIPQPLWLCPLWRGPPGLLSLDPGIQSIT